MKVTGDDMIQAVADQWLECAQQSISDAVRDGVSYIRVTVEGDTFRIDNVTLDQVLNHCGMRH